MKRFIFFLAALAALVSCSEKEETVTKKTFKLNPETVTISISGGSATTELTSAVGSWTLTQESGADWCSASPTSGISGGTITVTADSNVGGEERTAVFTLTPGNLSKADPITLTAVQSGDETMAGFDGEDLVVSVSWDGEKRAAISYQALVYSFNDSGSDGIGDIAGITAKLDYLDELGVSAIWLSPIHPSTSYHGYDVEDYAAVNPDLGTESDLQTLINTAAQHDIKIYLDYVLNHSSTSHPWFEDVKVNGLDSEYADYYVLSYDPASDIAAGNLAQIATEGSNGYDSGQWYSTANNAGAEGIYKFTLNWTGSNPTITVTEATEDQITGENTTSGSNDKYLYYGDGVCLRFFETSTNIYELVIDFASSWGFLIRTSNTSWSTGTKYGAASNSDIVTLGKALTLYPSTSSFDPVNIQFTVALMYHSHFWTGSFADLNYGEASSCASSPAFIAVCEAADKWVNMGVGGFRLDAVKHIYHNADSDSNPTFLAAFYDRMNESYHSAGHTDDIYMVGEQLSEYGSVAPYYKGLPAFFEFSFWYRLKWALNAGTGRYFADNILSYQPYYAAYRSDYIEATKLSNHDEARTGSELGKDLNLMKLAGAVLLTSGGEPYVYQGEELGYWGVQDNGDEYVRTPIMWDKAGSKVASSYLDGKVDSSMLTASISVEAQEATDDSILNVYRYFGQLRNASEALAEGTMELHPTYNSSNADFSAIACWYMTSDNDKALVIHNFGSESLILTLDDDLSNPIGVHGTVRLSGSQVLVGPYASVVFDVE